MKYFIIVGERSGDLHASWLVKAILTKDPTAEVIAYGGDMMQAAGAQILSHYKEGAFMGFLEVVRNLPAIIRRMSQCKADIAAVSPDLLILVDYPGFNLKMAAYAKGIGLKTAYYISPKIWAWKKGRIKAIRKFVDHMFVIFPFEVSFYDSLSYQVNYVGNPLVEQIGAYKPVPLDVSSGAFTKLVAFLPGSRSQEVKASEPYILELASAKPEYLFLVTQVDNLPDSTYNEMRGVSNIRLIIDRTYDCLSAADVAIVTSGTATLETALLGVPQVVCYKTSRLSYEIGKRLVDIKYISLVNLIADKVVVTELIQDDYNTANVINHIDSLLHDTEERSKMVAEYQCIREQLGTESASANVANALAG